jgi:type IV pilus assembly protein PilV
MDAVTSVLRREPSTDARVRAASPAARRAAAFTLLETVIALGILSVGVLGVAASLLTALKFSTNSRAASQAMYLAEEQVEIMRLMQPADVLAMVPDDNFFDDPSNPIDPDPGDDDSTQFVRRWRIQDDTPEDGMMTITIEVDYTDRLGITRTVDLRTLKAAF